jgi:hypothetical protein
MLTGGRTNNLSVASCVSPYVSPIFRQIKVKIKLTLMNQHQLDTLFLVCLLGVNVSICFGRYSPIFRRLCTDPIWCNYVRRMRVGCVQVAVPQIPDISICKYNSKQACMIILVIN